MKTPFEIASDLIGIGKKRTEMPAAKLLVLAIFAGMFIALAAVGANTASSMIENPGVSKLTGALLFPAGLSMVLLAGSELFTGNSLIIIPVLEKEARLRGLLKNWLFVYIGNFIGAVLIALLINASNQLGLFNDRLAAFTINIAAVKSSLSFGGAFVLGILCNFLVCVAIIMAMAAKDVAGRVAGLYFPVMLFVLSGFEHSVANMYYVPAGLFALADPAYAEAAAAAGVNTSSLTWGNFILNNLIPVTLGNIIGGVVLVGFAYWFLYLNKSKSSSSELSAKM